MHFHDLMDILGVWARVQGLKYMKERGERTVSEEENTHCSMCADFVESMLLIVHNGHLSKALIGTKARRLHRMR